MLIIMIGDVDISSEKDKKAAFWASLPRKVQPRTFGGLTSVFEMGTGEHSSFGRH
jgi:hypothetical protein